MAESKNVRGMAMYFTALLVSALCLSADPITGSVQLARGPNAAVPDGAPLPLVGAL